MKQQYKLAATSLLLGLVTLTGCSEQASSPAPSEIQVDYAANAARWAADEFQPTSLTAEQQAAELAWFTQAAAVDAWFRDQCGVRSPDHP